MGTPANNVQPGDGELRPEYDFRSVPNVARGKYAAQYRERKKQPMQLTSFDELGDFHRFVSEKLNNGGAALSPEEVLDEVAQAASGPRDRCRRFRSDSGSPGRH